MRIVPTTVAVLATALMFSSLASPVLAGGKKHHKPKFDIDFTQIFGSLGTPAKAGTSGTNTIVYFGTCKNLLGFVGGGNADEDGFCEPYESLTGDQGEPAVAATGPTDPACQVTVSKKKKKQYGRGGRSSSEGGESWSESWSTTYPGSCPEPHQGHSGPSY